MRVVDRLWTRDLAGLLLVFTLALLTQRGPFICGRDRSAVEPHFAVRLRYERVLTLARCVAGGALLVIGQVFFYIAGRLGTELRIYDEAIIGYVVCIATTFASLGLGWILLAGGKRLVLFITQVRHVRCLECDAARAQCGAEQEISPGDARRSDLHGDTAAPQIEVAAADICARGDSAFSGWSGSRAYRYVRDALRRSRNADREQSVDCTRRPRAAFADTFDYRSLDVLLR